MAKSEQKKVSADKLLSKLPKAILEGTSVRTVAMQEGLSQKSATALATAISAPIEDFNAKLADELGRVANVYLRKIEDAADDMPAASLAYTFAVLVDKRTALTGRTNPAGVHVNLQVNNNGIQMDKETLMDLLEGKKKPQTLEASTSTPAEPDEPNT